jgi:large subunit ribosomal protein L16
MLFPKKVKHRKWQTQRKSEKRLSRPDTRGTTIAFGSLGLKASTRDHECSRDEQPD